jgi:hypothetical protein
MRGPNYAEGGPPATSICVIFLHERDRSMGRDENFGTCEHCQRRFRYRLGHSGFGDCVYAYCDSCGRTAILSLWDKRMPNLPDCPVQCEMCSAMEPYLQPCECGGSFRRGSSPRCPHCIQPLSAELATSYIEGNAPGTKKGWRWQRNWSGLYCVVVEERAIHDNFG